MKSWNSYKASSDYENSFFWAMTGLRTRPERAAELGVLPENNYATPEMRLRNIEGSLWAAFLAGFGAAGGKVSF
jgi:hypothetical protein